MSAPAATGVASSLYRSGIIKPAVVVFLPVAAALGVMGVLALTVTYPLVGSQLTPGPPSPAAVADVPPAVLAVYRAAIAAVCPQMPWPIVAAIGTVESGNGTSNLPGVHSGANSAGAEGPMQFEPATFAAYDYPVPPGGASPPSPYDPIDAVYAAVRMLCANGAGSGDPRAAVFAYNHSAAYVNQVWSIALSYGMAADGSPASALPSGATNPGPGATTPGDPNVVIDFALSQLGVPYQWGGTTPGVSLDCSGLVYLSYRAAGISLPRTSYQQVSYGVTVPTDALSPADVLFFNDGTPFGHVAIYLGGGIMIQAPYTGTVVQIDPVSPSSIELARRIIFNP